MNSKIEYALIWKEMRQSGPIVAAFSIMTFIIVGYLCWLHHYSPDRHIHYTLERICELLQYYVFFISLGMTYMMSAGNRLLEANDNLETFMFIRPVERLTLVRVYYFVGLVCIALWFVVFFALVYLFFGNEIFKVSIQPRYDQNLLNFGLLISLASLFIAHGVTFALSMISPSLISSSVVYVLCYVMVIAVYAVSMQQQTSKFPEVFAAFFLRFVLPIASIGLLAGFIVLTIFYYQKKQVR